MLTLAVFRMASRVSTYQMNPSGPGFFFFGAFDSFLSLQAAVAFNANPNTMWAAGNGVNTSATVKVSFCVSVAILCAGVFFAFPVRP